MTLRRHRLSHWVLCALTVAAIGLSNDSVSSGETQKRSAENKTQNSAASLEKPFFVLNVAGVDRLLSDIDFVSKTVGRPQWALAIRALLALTGELKGIDRTRPFGTMAFIDPGEAHFSPRGDVFIWVFREIRFILLQELPMQARLARRE